MHPQSQQIVEKILDAQKLACLLKYIKNSKESSIQK